MELFLTSQIGAAAHVGGKRVSGKIDSRWGFLSHFQRLPFMGRSSYTFRAS